jgi:hypothetical protein
MDLPLIERIKQLRVNHQPKRDYPEQPPICVECNLPGAQGGLELFPCATLRAYDALIRVADLSRFLGSPINVGLDTKQAAAEIDLAIKFATTYNLEVNKNDL